MVDSLGLSALIVVLLALLVAVHVAWWGFKVYLPSATFCQTVHRLQRQWLAKALACFKIPDISAFGFVAAVFWPAIVLMNLLLLAQVMELFFPGGGRIDLGVFGSYSAFALVAGALFSASQMLFGLVYGESQSRSLKVLFFFLLVGTIFTEAGLAWYRTKLIVEGAEPVAGTMVDQVMASSGPWLAAAVGFVVPISHTAAGYVAFPKFLLPAIGYSIRCVGGMAMLIWTTLCFLYFGFHDGVPVEVPRWIADLRIEANALQEQAAALRASSVGARERQRAAESIRRDLEACPALPEFESRLQALTADRTKIESEWDERDKKLRDDPKSDDLSRLYDLSATIAAQLDVMESQLGQVLGRARRLKNDLKSMKDRPRLYNEYQQRRGEVESHVTRGGAELGALTAAQALLETKQREILGVWTGDVKVTTTLSGLESKITEIRTESESLTRGSPERKVASLLFDLCHSVVAKDVSDGLASTRSVISEYEQVKREMAAPAKNAAATDAPPPPGHLTELEHRVDGVEAVVDVAARHQKELSRRMKDVVDRCREIERKPAWLYFLKDLVGWTSAR